MKTWVYKHFDEEGTVLYVGVSNDPMMRTRSHEKEADWFDDVRSIDVKSYPTREDALEAEANEILSSRPLYNKSVIVNGRVIRVHYKDKLREDYLQVRPKVLHAVSQIGIEDFAKEVELSEATLFRICMTEISTPIRKTIEKLEAYFSSGGEQSDES